MRCTQKKFFSIVASAIVICTVGPHSPTWQNAAFASGNKTKVVIPKKIRQKMPDHYRAKNAKRIIREFFSATLRYYEPLKQAVREIEGPHQTDATLWNDGSSFNERLSLKKITILVPPDKRLAVEISAVLSVPLSKYISCAAISTPRTDVVRPVKIDLGGELLKGLNNALQNNHRTNKAYLELDPIACEKIEE